MIEILLNQEYPKRKKELEEAEAAFKQAKKSMDELTQELIPAWMDQNNITKLDTTDFSVVLKEDVKVSISKSNRPHALAWLVAHGHDDVVKSTVGLEFCKGREEEAKKVVALLANHGYTPFQVQDAHSSTIKSILKKELENGTDVPLSLFGAFHYRYANIKPKEAIDD